MDRTIVPGQAIALAAAQSGIENEQFLDSNFSLVALVASLLWAVLRQRCRCSTSGNDRAAAHFVTRRATATGVTTENTALQFADVEGGRTVEAT